MKSMNTSIMKILVMFFLVSLLCIEKSFSQKNNNLNVVLSEDNQRMFSETGIIRCLSVEIDHLSRQQFPNRGTSEEFEQWLAPLVDEYKSRAAISRIAPLLTIPIVFHIITDGAGVDNVSAALVQAQLDQLNLDFRNLAGSIDPAAADIEVQFCLAMQNPLGNLMAEPGINRVTSYGDGPFTSNTVDNTIKPNTQWNPEEYMNIWSANLSGGLLGWAQFPDNSGLAGLNANGGAGNTDGVVVGAGTIGSVANPGPSAPYNLGRTLTHEVGHWLGLRHIWGDGGCGVDDFCGDTPESDASNGGCPNHTSCGTQDMVENYMDYTNDACMNIFTADQKARMRAVLGSSPRRANLQNSNKCNTPSPTIGFFNGGGTIINERTDCSFQDVLLDLNISMAPSDGATVTFISTGTATNGVDYDISPASVIFPTGTTPTRQVRVRIYNDGVVEPIENILLAFNVTTAGDAVAAGADLADHDITINDDDLVPSSGGTITLLNQDFESGLAPFTTQGQAGSDRFLVANALAASSPYWTIANSNATQFAYSNDDNCNCNKSNDRLRSPVFSLDGAYTSATLTFDHAFADLPTETAEVQISTGGGYTLIATLANTSAITGGGAATTPWVNGVTVDLTPYIGQATVQVRFRYNDGGGWMYGLAIDNVLVTADAAASIQVTDNTTSPQNILLRGMETVHYYDLTSGDVMGTIQNLSTWDYQCTRVEVDRDATSAGGPTVPFWDVLAANALAAKTFFVDPDTNTTTGSYKITLYYTEEEIANWETTTGKSRTTLYIHKVVNDRVSNVNPSNYASFTIEQQQAVIGIYGAGLTFEATFNTGIHGGYALGGVVRTATWTGITWIWNDGTSDGIVPTFADKANVIIAGFYDTSAPDPLQISFGGNNLTVNSPYDLTIADGTYIDIENEIVADGDITVATKGSVVQRNDSATVTGAGIIAVQKVTTVLNSALEYTYWSSSVVGETVENVFWATPVTRRYSFSGLNFEDNLAEINNTGVYNPGQDDIDDNANAWQLASGPLLPGSGYAAMPSPFGPFPAAQQIIFVGAFNNGVIQSTIYNNSGGVYNDWNFIGNPYPSAISTVDFFNVNSGIVDTIYLWNQATHAAFDATGNEGANYSSSDYAVISASGINTAGGDLSLIPGDFVPSGQGFFIEALSGTSVTFNNSMRETGNNYQFFRSANTIDELTDSRQVLWLNLNSDNGVAKQIAVAHLDGATNAYDGSLYDVKENLSTGNAALIYSVIADSNTNKFVIQGRNVSSLDEDEIIPIGFKTSITVPTLYKISIAQFEGEFYTETNIYIKDNVLSVLHNLKDSDYNFTSETGEFNNRFEIVFRADALSISDQALNSNDLTITELLDGNVEFRIGRSFIITNVEILDVVGRQIYNLKGNSSTERYDLSRLNKAAYVAKVTLSNGQIISKKAIKRK
jgi:hypothetical protein